ncbi:MBL fold metallo-hydrolase [Cohnella caldifontis]|uniref:MBL fold metallo-hydrolase n=1 Tax=Cohnella caldifontis TaxID=3027471 RepID=UPI0023EB1A91|nr:MBL fold metallo-hydrolase [Cohnella sp. YIM B05605]
MDSDLETASVREWPGGWLQVKVPLPYSLKWVNAYLLPGDNGWTLIDPGLRTPESEKLWEQTLADKGIHWAAIKRIVLTHHHPDHYGLAGWFQERSGGAPVWMSDEAGRAAWMMWGEGETFSARMLEAMRRHGLPQELTEAMREHLSGFRGRVSPHPTEVRTLKAGGKFEMAGTEWTLIGGEGHGPGHLSFYDPRGRRILCGDQVLPDISPNIGWLPEGDPNPLASFMDSLKFMLDLEVDLAFPGHRDPFGRFRDRLVDLLAHHERRLERLIALIGSDALSSFEICERLFGARLRSNPHNLRFALAETIAHLLLLERRGLLRQVNGGGTWRGAADT